MRIIVTKKDAIAQMAIGGRVDHATPGFRLGRGDIAPGFGQFFANTKLSNSAHRKFNKSSLFQDRLSRNVRIYVARKPASLPEEFAYPYTVAAEKVSLPRAPTLRYVIKVVHS